MNRKDDGKEVVVKVWKEPLETDVEEKYFIREVMAGCTMNHPNCIRYYGYSEIPNEENRGSKKIRQPIIIMEKGKGSLLEYLQANKVVDIKIRLSYINQIADGLSYIHNQGYIHRDLKVLIMI